MRLEMGDLSWLTDEQMARLEPFSRRAMGNLVWIMDSLVFGKAERQTVMRRCDLPESPSQGVEARGKKGSGSRDCSHHRWHEDEASCHVRPQWQTSEFLHDGRLGQRL